MLLLWAVNDRRRNSLSPLGLKQPSLRRAVYNNSLKQTQQQQSKVSLIKVE